MPFVTNLNRRRRRRRRPAPPARREREREREMDDSSKIWENIEHNTSVVLDHIHDYYKEALNRLPLELIPSLLGGGFCFGFLDPVSNIIANTVSYAHREEERDEEREKKKRKRSDSKEERKNQSELETRQREEAISKIITECSKGIGLVPRRSNRDAIRSSSIAARSFRGLVTFLTSYFRYLTDSDVVCYLLLSKANLLVAVQLIEVERCTVTFTIDSPTTKTALACAAISAMHPWVVTFVSRSYRLALHLDKVSKLLARQQHCLSPSSVKKLSMLLTSEDPTINPREPMQHAISRLQLQHRKKETVPAGLEMPLKRVLLDKIHGFYLKAISCMPKHDLSSCHHRGLLKAGHCYGPFNPVTNIILNTIWYDTTFPAAKQEFVVDMISTKSLVRIECRSLCGLVSFVRALFPALSVYDTMQHLLLNNFELDRVIVKAKLEGHEYTSCSESDAYEAAALSAYHPNPAALVKFAMSVMRVEGISLKSALKDKRMLSSADVRAISESLSRKFLWGNVKPVEKLTLYASQMVLDSKKKFVAHQNLIRTRVEAALHKYAQKVGHKYELHVICGVNDGIPKDGCYGYLHFLKSGYPYSHINIWARRKGSKYADAVPTLFFIECSIDYEDMQDTPFLCCPVSESSDDAGRCFYCEFNGTKIVHPPAKTYLGRCWNFEDMASGEHPVCNEELVESGEHETVKVGLLEDDDLVYFDPSWDARFASYINLNARRLEEEARELEETGTIDLTWLSEWLEAEVHALEKQKSV